MLRVATWNVNSLRVRLPQVLAWLGDVEPDILAMQETKTQDLDFPAAAFAEIGYAVVCNGQKTYNGVAIASRTPGSILATALPGYDDTQRRFLAMRFGDVQLIDVYVPNGEDVASDKYRYKLEWLAALRDFLARSGTGAKTIVLGDFNIAPDDRDVHDPAAWQGQVLVSDPERTALKRLFDTGVQDCFRLFDQPAGLYSWWDYRAGALHRNHGLRIDLILASANLAARCRQCRIDAAPRRWERPSDHAPVLAEFDV
jgi:exodeoxyribonuclease-3